MRYIEGGARVKKIIGVIAAIAICAILSIVYSLGDGDKYAEEKYIGSDDYKFLKVEIKDFDYLLNRTDIIVRGYARTNGETVKEKVTVQKELDEKYKNMFGKDKMSTFTNFEFVVTEVIYGDDVKIGSEITIQQYGEAGNDRGQTKLKKNEEVIMLLKQRGEGVFRSVGLENGTFTVTEDGTIVTHGDDEAVIQFDKEHKDKLTKRIAKFQKNKSKK